MTVELRGGARFTGFDGLRTVAVLLVVLFHQGLLECGWVGVQIFFVLSGYLITRILVKAKGGSVGRFLLDFYGRRSLRIFPLYFGVLAALWLAVSLGVHFEGVRSGLPYAATYTYNIFHASRWFEHSKLMTHFWSLCVEEQFYLVWPLLIYFCPRARLRHVLVALVLCGPIVRAALFGALSSPSVPALPDVATALYVLTPTHLDAFAAGGYIALFPLGGSRKLLFASATMVLAAGALVSILGHSGARADGFGSLGYGLGLEAGHGYIWGYSLLTICFALLIDCIAHRRFAPRFFEHPWMTYLGKISYGLYIFHFPLQSAVAKLLPQAPIAFQLAIQTALTVAVASLSFHLWEERFSALKDVFFPVNHAAPAVALSAPLLDSETKAT